MVSCVGNQNNRMTDKSLIDNNRVETMREFKRLWIMVASATFFYVSGVSAQEEGPTGVVEIFACNYVGNSDMDDLLAVTETFNGWADENNISDYGAFILTPFFYSDQLTPDVIWIGTSPNAASASAGDALWLSEGQEVQADFDEVVNCSSHAQYAVVPINTPSGPPPEEVDGPGLVAFSDCAIHDGRSVPEAIAAHGEWSEYLAENGSDTLSLFLFGVAGQRDDINYNFKTVRGFPNAEAYGQYVDIVTAGGFLRAEELFGRLLDCDSPRVYVTNQVRQATQEE